MKLVYDEISFLISLCKLTEQGKFQPNLGIKVRDSRIEREAMRQRARSAPSASVSDESEAHRENAGPTVRRASHPYVRPCVSPITRNRPLAPTYPKSLASDSSGITCRISNSVKNPDHRCSGFALFVEPVRALIRPCETTQLEPRPWPTAS